MTDLHTLADAETTNADPTAGLRQVLSRLSAACLRGGRARDAARLIAVTKTQEPDTVRRLLSVGHRLFGENRVQEAAAKFPALRQEFPDLVLHLIGPLQSNKAREAVGLFDVIETLDRRSLAEALAAERARGARLPRLLVQVNTGLEPQKAGVGPRDLAEFLDRVCTPLDLKVDGLMCIPPRGDAPGPHFALLGKLARDRGLSILSMGMSDDFETAAALGATHVRVGSAIFGSRT